MCTFFLHEEEKTQIFALHSQEVPNWNFDSSLWKPLGRKSIFSVKVLSKENCYLLAHDLKKKPVKP